MNALYRLYEAAEGWVCLAATTDREWRSLVRAIGETALAVDERFVTQADRSVHDAELVDVLRGVFRTRPAAEWESTLTAAGVGCVDVFLEGYQAFTSSDRGLRDAGTTVEVDHPLLGRLVRFGPPIVFSETPWRLAPSCLRGEHNRAVLSSLGYSDAEITDLTERGVLFAPDSSPGVTAVSGPAARYVGATVSRKEDKRLLTGHGVYVARRHPARHAARRLPPQRCRQGDDHASRHEGCRRAAGRGSRLHRGGLRRHVRRGVARDARAGAPGAGAPGRNGCPVRRRADRARRRGGPLRRGGRSASSSRSTSIPPTRAWTSDLRLRTPSGSSTGPGVSPPTRWSKCRSRRCHPISTTSSVRAATSSRRPSSRTDTSVHRWRREESSPRGCPSATSSTSRSRVRACTRPATSSRGTWGSRRATSRVHARDVGGGFGQKMFVFREECAVVLAARRLGATVKWIEDRRENLIAAAHSRNEYGKVRLAIDDDHVIQAITVEHVADVGAYPPCPAVMDPMLLPGPYKIPRLGFSTTMVWTNTMGKGAYRGPWMFETTAREMAIDHAARAIGIDPIELRRANLLAARTSRSPHRAATSSATSRRRETLEQALDMLGFDEFRASSARPGRRDDCWGWAAPSTSSRRRWAHRRSRPKGATVRIESSGKVRRLSRDHVARAERRDDDGADRRRHARRLVRRRDGRPGSRPTHALRAGDRWFADRGRGRRCGSRRRARWCATRCSRSLHTRSRRRRRISTSLDGRVFVLRHTDPRCHASGGGDGGVPVRGAAATGGRAGPGGYGPVPARVVPDLVECGPPLRRRGRP